MEPKATKTPKTKIKKIKITRTHSAKTEQPAEHDVFESLEEIDSKIDEQHIEEKPIEDISEKFVPLNIESFDWTYEIKEKHVIFYFLLFLVSAIVIYLGYKYNNWILTLIVILGFVMIVQRNTKVDTFRIDAQGITIQNQQLFWSGIGKCGIEKLNDNASLIALIPNSFPFSKIYVPFQNENQREIISLVNKYSKLDETISSTFDEITKKIIF
jgi:hypothetical protein